MDTYACAIKREVPEPVASAEVEVVEPVETPAIVLTPLEQYMIENDSVLHDFNMDLKEHWEHLGLLTDLKHLEVVRIIEQCITVTEIPDQDLDESDEDYETDIE